MKNQRKLFVCLGVIAIALMGVFSWSYMLKPVKAISFDVNPSFEIEINRFGNVARINTVNEDAKELLKGYDPSNEDLDDVVEVIMNRLIDAGYIKDNQRNCIMVSGSKDNSTKALKEVNEEVNEALKESNLYSYVLNQDIKYNEKMVDEAHDNNISFGKYAIIEKLLNDDDDNITLEELSKYSVDELIQFAKENKLDVEELVDEYNDNLEDLLEDRDEKHREQAEEAKDLEEDRLDDEREAREDERERIEDEKEEKEDADEDDDDIDDNDQEDDDEDEDDD